MSDNVDIWLWLMLVMGANNPRLGKILENCGYDPAKAGVIIRDNKDPSLTAAELSRAKSTRIGTVRDYKRFCEVSGVSIIAYGSENYPALLKEIENPPPVLFALGDVSGLNEKTALAVVGTRKISDYGLEVTDSLVKPLAKAGVVIVSGIAVGADRAAHEACLDAGGRTLAFPGCGVLENHPRENEDLKKRIIENGGAIISELLPDKKAEIHYFRRRDAIMSGVCRGVLVTEAGDNSGSLITANYALEQGRAVFAVPPHNILLAKYSGTAILRRKGATFVFDETDIARVLGIKTEKPGYTKKTAEPKEAGSAKSAAEPKKAAPVKKKLEGTNTLGGATIIRIKNTNSDTQGRAVEEKMIRPEKHGYPPPEYLPSEEFLKDDPKIGAYLTNKGVVKTFEEIRAIRPKKLKSREGLCPLHKAILEYLDNDPAYLVAIAEDLGQDSDDVFEALLLLMTNGYVERETGGIYRLK